MKQDKHIKRVAITFYPERNKKLPETIRLNGKDVALTNPPENFRRE